MIELALGLTVYGATIVPAQDALGSITGPGTIYGYEGTSARERAARARDEIIVLYAGMAADRVFCGTPFEVEASGAGSDHNQAWELVRFCSRRRGGYVGDVVDERKIISLQRRAIREVRKNADAIRRVVSLLMERGTLSAAEIAEAAKI